MSPELMIRRRWGCLQGLYFVFIFQYNYKIYMPLVILAKLTILQALSWTVMAFNQSLCGSFRYEGVYYNLNSKHNNENIKTANYLYNYCERVQYYCEDLHEVVTGSLIYFHDQLGCVPYSQQTVSLIQEDNLMSGVKVKYKLADSSINASAIADLNSSIIVNHKCRKNEDVWVGQGCPSVEQSIIFDYLSRQELGFTIGCQILGVLLMIMGVYIYRVSIVLIGAFSMFVILLAIEVPILFYQGVPDQVLSNVMLLTAICSFFGGYVAAYFPKIGLFTLGAWMGIILSLTLNNIAFYYISSFPANLTLWIVMPILAVAFGIMGLFIKKTFIIFATSLIGAYLCLRALSWHLGAFPNEFLLARNYNLDLVGPVEWQFYLYVISLLILTASSSALQYWLFNKKNSQGSDNINDHFDKMEEEMAAKRQDLVKFKGIFKKNKNSAPKKLRKGHEDDDDEDQYEEDQSNEEEDDEDEGDNSSSNSIKKQQGGLKKKLIIK